MHGPVLGLYGGADEGIPPEHVEAFERGLAEAGVEYEIVTYPGAPHSFFDRRYEEHAARVRRRLAARPGVPLAALLLGVLARPPVKPVRAGAAGQHVVAVAARQAVGAVAAVQRVVAVAALQPVAPRVAEDRVVASAARRSGRRRRGRR